MLVNINIPSRYNQALIWRNYIEALCGSLFDLGHDVLVNFDHFPLDADFNFITHPQLLIKYNPEAALALLKCDKPYFLLETEVINENLNGYGDESIPERRYSEAERDLYIRLTQQALFAGGPVKLCKTLSRVTDRIEQVRYNYHPCLERISHWPEKKFDVLFYGSFETEERRDVLQRLSQSGLSVIILGYCDQSMRDSYIAASRIVLNINVSATGSVSTLRTIFCAANKVACLSNRVEDLDGELELCHVSESDDLVEGCKKYLAERAWVSEGVRVYNTLRSRQSGTEFWKEIFKKYL